MQGIGGDYLTDERMVHMRTSHLYGEIGSQSSGAHANAKTVFASLTKILTFRQPFIPVGSCSPSAFLS